MAEGRSLAQQLADLPEDKRAAIFGGMTSEQADAILHDWRTWARPNQLTPPGEWLVWLIMAGRGFGKTRSGAEDVAAYGRTHPNSRIALVAATFTDGRDTMVEGESGLLACLRADELRGGSQEKAWNRSLGELWLKNGTKYKLYSAEKPDQLRGPQHHRAWCDEVAAWTYPDAFDMLKLGLRLGKHPQCVVTTTPKPKAIIRDLAKRAATGDGVILTHGTTYENLENLAEPFRREVLSQYEGTTLGQQELYARILDEYPGAYWKRSDIDRWRITWDALPEMQRIVVGVDPAATSKKDSDETGICAAGLGIDNRFYVLHCQGYRLTPKAWAQRVVQVYEHFRADRIVAEINQGGEMVESTIREVNENVAVKTIHASRGKALRAEPVSALYEQGRVSHVGVLADLEDQQCAFPIADDQHDDLVDACVYAITELMGGGVATGVVEPEEQLARPSRIFTRT